MNNNVSSVSKIIRFKDSLFMRNLGILSTRLVSPKAVSRSTMK